jgi:hypothetical protein
MKAIVDTTILADALLKTDLQHDKAIAALASYTETLLPVYGIKEFKAGPLHYYVWTHNKAVEASSLREVVEAIRNNIGYRRNLPATALQAVGDFHGSIASQLTQALANKYPEINRGEADLVEFRIWIKQKIYRAWRNRRRQTTAVISPIPCYTENDLTVRNSGQISDDPLRCKVKDCSLRLKYADRLDAVELLENTCVGTKNETVKRRQALNQLRRHPKKDYEEKNCRALGDAIFALECRSGAEILTTNIADHGPLAAALGFKARAP